MADHMTLEQVRDEMRAWRSHTGFESGRLLGWADAIDAAIREWDRLRGDVFGMTEELLRVPSREEWRALQKRAERAEAELAALKSQPFRGRAQDAIDRFAGGEELSHEEMCEVVNQAVCAERELAAIKARIAESVIGKPIECDFESMTVTLQVDASFSTNGKPFRLVVEE